MKRLAKILLEMDLITQQDYADARKVGKKKGIETINALLELGFVTSEDLLLARGQRYNMGVINVLEEEIPTAVIKTIKADYAKTNRVLPIQIEDGTLIVAISDPNNRTVVDDLQFMLSMRVEPQLTEDADLTKALETYYSDRAQNLKEAEELTDAGDHEDEGLAKLVNQIITQAHYRGVSDIHIEPYPEEDVNVRFRADGVCYDFMKVPRQLNRAVISRLKVMSNLDISEKRLPQDGKIKFKEYGPLDIELRVATIPTQGGVEDCVMRILAGSKPLPLDKMGFMPDVYERFLVAVKQPYGLVLVCGPTGSGKTTTLHSALGFINKPDRKIWTAEDPVEITQSGLRQVQVQAKIGLTFARAMRAFLRADPDVIMIGEMRDAETAEAGVEASLTGHLVFSTLHTNSAPETVTRLLDIGVDRFSFGDSLLGVLAQRLIRTFCKNCRKPLRPTRDAVEKLYHEFRSDTNWKRLKLGRTAEFYDCPGCDQCNGNGYKGRMGIHEFMANSEAIREAIFEKMPVIEMTKIAEKEGMTTLKQDGIRKVLAGHSNIEEIRRVCIK